MKVPVFPCTSLHEGNTPVDYKKFEEHWDIGNTNQMNWKKLFVDKRWQVYPSIEVKERYIDSYCSWIYTGRHWT